MRSSGFRNFFFAMPIVEREAFAGRAHTSRGLLTQVAYGNKRVELGFADVIVALADGAVTLDDLPLTDNAARQRLIREGRMPPRRNPPATALAEA